MGKTNRMISLLAVLLLPTEAFAESTEWRIATEPTPFEVPGESGAIDTAVPCEGGLLILFEAGQVGWLPEHGLRLSWKVSRFTNATELRCKGGYGIVIGDSIAGVDVREGTTVWEYPLTGQKTMAITENGVLIAGFEPSLSMLQFFDFERGTLAWRGWQPFEFPGEVVETGPTGTLLRNRSGARMRYNLATGRSSHEHAAAKANPLARYSIGEKKPRIQGKGWFVVGNLLFPSAKPVQVVGERVTGS